jgi:FKBP-type peptidyl-prolyl cis-trans isomerase FklB
MRTFLSGFLFTSLAMAASACQSDSTDRDSEPVSTNSLTRLVPQVLPPLDLRAQPDDAIKTASGLSYWKLTARKDGARPQRSDTVLVHYTGWRQRTGETFFTTRGVGRPIALDVARAAPGFSEALQLLRTGEKAVLWMPSSGRAAEPLVYEIEVVDIVALARHARRGSDGVRGQPEAAAASAQVR